MIDNDELYELRETMRKVKRNLRIAIVNVSIAILLVSIVLILRILERLAIVVV